MKTKKIRTGAADIQAEILTRWVAAVGVLDGYTKKQIDNFFFSLKRGIINRIIAKAGSNARLGRIGEQDVKRPTSLGRIGEQDAGQGGKGEHDAKHPANSGAWDEDIFEYYKRLMEYYNDTVLIYVQEKDKIKNTKIKVILGGIYSVLTSELKQYRDGIKDHNQNPVRAEKKEIIKKSIELFLTGFDSSYTDFNHERLGGCIEYGRRELSEEFSYDASARLVAFIMEENECFYLEHIYMYYRDALIWCVERLNNAESRQVTYYYYDLLKKEQEILSSIIKIQVGALEREIERNGCKLEEMELVNIILSNLREGYQYLGGEIKDIMASFKEASDRENDGIKESYADFIAYIRSTTASFSTHTFENVKMEYNERLNAFTQCLHKELDYICDKRLGEYVLKKSVYEAQKKLSEQLTMTDEMTEAFRQLTVYYSENKNSLEATEGYEITRGINETIEIKIESINENGKLFAESCNEMISGFVNDKRHITQEEKESIFNSLYDGWRKEFMACSPCEDGQDIDIKMFFDNFLSSGQITEIVQKTERLRQSREEQVNKAIINFKREHLLYEVSTFEEILCYSVSRLRELGDPASMEYVSFIDLITAEIKTILKKNNITVIEPVPHDMFNGKEHEVLMAEKNEQYNKGEIIKLMNSGYKQNETVILRANVIAAK